jgi:hypothetical protein
MQEFEEQEIEEATSLPGGLNLTIGLLALAFCIFLFSQISNIGQASRSMQWQGGNLDRQIASLVENEKNLSSLLTQRETAVQQAQQVQSRYTEMLNDLLTLAETDADARSVVEKYRVQRQQNQTADPAASPNTP